MADFSDAHKAERSSNYFDEGIHKVTIGAYEFGTTTKDQEYCEVEVFDPKDEERTAKTRFWFTTDGAIGYAFNILRTIFVHNAPEDKKDAVRDKFNAIKNTTELEKEMAMLVGKECWLQVYQDGSYIDGNGKTKPNYSRDIYGYEPAPKAKVETGPLVVQDDDGNEQTIATF